jgi:hypothetical protein
MPTMQTITPDFLMSQLRLALVALLAYGGGKGWFTPADTTFYLALASSLGPVIVPWAWSIFSNLGKVSVVSGSAAATVAAVEKKDPASASAGAATAVAATAKILMVAFLLSAMLIPSAFAQTRKLAPPALTGDLKKDLNTDGQNLGLIPPSLVVQPTGNASQDLQALWQKIIAASNADLAYASKLAAGAGTQSSLIRKQCWDAITALNTQANGLNLKDASGNPVAKPDPHLFTDVETLAEVVDNLSPQGPLFTSCAGAAQLAKTNVLTFINSVVTGAAGIAAMPIIPGL